MSSAATSHQAAAQPPDAATAAALVPLLAELPTTDLGELAAMWQLQQFAAGEVVLDEAHANDILYVLLEGTVAVRKRWDSADQQPLSADNSFELAQLQPGACFGELSFLDGDVTSAAVVALTASLILAIPAHMAERHLPDETLLRLRAAVATAVVRRMRGLNEAHVRSLTAELEQQHVRVEFARFFAVTMVLFGIASAVQKLISTDIPPENQLAFSWGLLLVSLAPLAWFALRQRLPLREFGLTRRGWQKSLREALLWCVPVVLAAIAVRAVTRHPGEQWVRWGGTVGNYPPAVFWAWQLAYPLHCSLQELMGRGIIQGALQRFMTTGHPLTPIVMTSALFGVYHLYVSLTFAVITFAVSMALGLLYRRHTTLLGVCLLHYVLGLASVAIGLN
jgi:CRP-like cAMP-binding protein